jgi:hypothetical protein
MATKVALQYGVLTGRRVGKKFCKTLAEAGYQLVQNAQDADIIIGHSAGCFWLPQAPTKQKLMLINPPYWPGRSVTERAKARARTHLRYRRYGYNFKQWLWRSAWGAFYGLDIPRTRLINRVAREYELEKIITNHTAVIVRNSDDDWLTPDVEKLTHDHPGVQVVHIPGDHDDLWLNPRPYVEALERLA